jgi:hypothetical protein
MEAYTGFEPQVGEIRAVRTFRIGPNGSLYPLFSDVAWSAGTNTARCRFAPHATPETGCTCGYYAYASDAAASEYPNARHVLAVVSCWGHVIAGTRGIRAEFARIDAIWMSDAVPAGLAALVATRYPGLSIYADKQAMLAQHPPTVLDCYQNDPSERAVRRIGLRLAILLALVMGVLPTSWLGSNDDARLVWAAELGFFLIGAVVLHRKRTDLAAKRQALVFVAVALWLVAPFAGAGGTLMLRLPLIQIAALTAYQRWLLTQEARRFPARIGQQPG